MKFAAGEGVHHAEITRSNYVKLQISTPKYCSNEIMLSSAPQNVVFYYFCWVGQEIHEFPTKAAPDF